MNLLQKFVNFLLKQKNKPSLLTIKNYKADIGQFVSWFEKEFNPLGDQASSFDPAKVTLQILQQYKKTRSLSENSIKRHMSSLRKFFCFLKLEKIILYNPLERLTVSAEARALEDPWMIRGFKNFLYEYKKSNLTIKNYINDIENFFTWLEEAALVKYTWNVTDRNLLNKINSPLIEEYKQRLIIAKFSPLTINRKLSSLRSYISWAKSQGLIQSSVFSSQFSDLSSSVVGQSVLKNRQLTNQNLKTENREPRTESSFPPTRLMQKSLKGISVLFDNLFILPLARTLEAAQYFFWKTRGRKIFVKSNLISKDSLTKPVSNIQREFYAPLSLSIRYLPTHKKVWHYLRHVRPNWYKSYHSYSISHYLHFAILIILSCVVGFGLYDRLFVSTQKTNAVLSSSTAVLPRILSYQGKLTDSLQSPVTKEVALLFSIYDNENASSEASLWQENNIVKPDADGSFSVLLGKKNPIPDTAFNQNSKLFLGIAVGNDPELTPRQELATVPFAGNANTLQGLEPITNTAKTSNVILALDSSGNLSIAGAKTHTVQVIGGNFILSGKVLSLTTVIGSNSNVEILPDGIGQIDLTKPIQNSTNNNNLVSAAGSVEFDDTVAILATASSQSALYINQNSTGPLISASTSGIAKFAIENDGTGKFAGNLAINGTEITSTATTFNFLNSAVSTLNIAGAASTINIGTSTGTTTIKSNLTVNKDFTLPSFTSNGGLLYANGSGKIYQASAGSSSDCFTGGTTPSFISCSKILNQAASVGIGTTAPLFKLDVQDLQDATAAAQIYNTSTAATATGLIVKLGNASASLSASNHFINFETAGVGIVGSIQGLGAGVTYATSGIADFAEYFKKDKNTSIPFGSTVCLQNNGLSVPCNSDNNKIIGVASERPAFLGGQNLGDGSIAVGLVGQIETFAANLNGEIKAGDMLTVSDIPGVAVKATKAGQIIGKALEDLTTDEAKVVGYYDPDTKEYRSKAGFPNISLKSNIVHVVKILASVNVSWYDPEAYFAQNGDLIINSTGSNGYSISNSKNETLNNLAGFLKIVTANIQAGLLNANEIITNTLVVTSDSIIVNGQNLKDYIINVVNESGIKNQESRIISPIVRTQEISTDIISPLGKFLIVKLATPSAEIHDSSFIIQNSSGSAVAKIDDQGNASFSGTINTLSLQTNEASISGTLRTDKIIANNIEGLENQDFSFLASRFSSNYVSLASYSAQLAYVPDLTVERAQFNQGLMVFGPTSLADLSIAGRLAIGATMFVTENSIETLGTDLSLQSLKQGGLSIMAGLVYIDTAGNVKIQGDLSVKGKLAVNNAQGTEVLSINQSGDLIASGSGTFTKLNFNLIQPVLAVSATEAIASSSAGVANIAPYRSELTIKNALMTDKSVIYITPVGTPSAQSPFLMRQAPDGFTVGVQSPTNRPIDFNWLIVN